MKSLLRRKTPTDNIKKPPPPSSTQRTRQPPTVETPLYARFASSKPAAQSLEGSRPVVSGPMPLGRPNRANLEADIRRKHEEEIPSRGRLSGGRRGHAASESLGAREVQSSLDRTSHDVPVDLPRPPTKTQMATFSDEQPVASRFDRIANTENVHHPRDILPSPPVSPQPSPHSQQLTRTTVNGSPSSSIPLVGKSYTTGTEVPAADAHGNGLYGEPRYPTSRSSKKPPFTNSSTSSATMLNPAEGPHKNANRFSAMGMPLSSNQASHDIEQLRSTSALPHQGAAFTPQLNGHVERTKLNTAPPVELPPKTRTSQDKSDRRMSRMLAGDPSLRSTGTPPPRDSVYRNISQTVVAETTPAPFIVTPPQSPEKHPTPARRANPQMRGYSHTFATPNPESKPAPEPTRRGPRIFNAHDDDPPQISYESESPHETGQWGHQHPQGPAKPLRGNRTTGSPERGSVSAPRSFSHPQPYKQEQVRAQATASYEDDEAPPTAHPAMRRISKGSTAGMHASQSLLENRNPSFSENSINSGHRNRLREKRSPPGGLSSAPNHASEQESAHPSWQTHLNGNLSVRPLPRPVPEQNTSSPESSTPPTPPEKPPPRNARGESAWLHHTERQFSSQPLAPTVDIDLEAGRDIRNGLAVLVPAEARSEEDYLPSDMEDSQEDIQETRPPNGFSQREPSGRAASSINGNSLRASTSVGQQYDDSYDSDVDSSDPQLDEPDGSAFEYGPRHPGNVTQQSWEEDGNLLASQSSVDVEFVTRPRRRTLPPPASPEEYSRARARRRGTWLEKTVPADIAELAEETKPKFYPLLQHLQNRELLTELLVHLSFYEWLILWGSVSKAIRQALDSDPALCDATLERYLGTVGYARWSWPSPEPIRITPTEMLTYMRGVSVPVHAYAQFASTMLSSPSSEEGVRRIHEMKKETRAFNRVVIRLRAQAEADAEQVATVRRKRSIGQSQSQRQNNGPPLSWSAGAAQGQGGRNRSVSRQSSRAPSPTNSVWSHGASQAHLPLGTTPTSGGFRSPLFRLRRAPLLRVFVPSPEGDWLSDTGVLECETELRKAGILPLLRVGDVIWDTALSDEGNLGRLVWDGRYLIDLDYTYSQIGDIPSSLPALAFPPSYFHRIIRVTGDRNPVANLDIRFWGEEIIANLQLLQDRVRTETPQGAYHTVVRWVHRSSFTIFPPPGGAPMIILPNRERRVVDVGWRGTVVVEAEGTNEGLADLHARCRGVFQPRAGDVAPPPGERERMVWRVLRERSRPGEIWIRAVSFKERLIP